VKRRWALAWLGGAVLGVANGAARDKLYARRLGELRAHQLSTGTLLGSLAAYTWALERRWPLPSAVDGATVGATWLGMTIASSLASAAPSRKSRGRSCWPTTTWRAGASGC